MGTFRRRAHRPWSIGTTLGGRFTQAVVGLHLQGAPGFALSDPPAPVGFLSWILEKYWDWSDHGEDPQQTLSAARKQTNG